MSSLRPFFCYFGGKWRAVPHYPKPLHRRIIEPFAGAAGYATRYADHDIVLVEKDPRIAALWRWLISPSTTSTTILKLPLWTGDHESIDDVPDLCPEARDLMGFWFNKGSAQPHRRPSSWMTSKVRPNSHWGEVVRSLLAAQVDAIKHWTVIEGDWTCAPDDTRATWFVDPPYQVDGRKYKCSSKDVDFTALGAVCRALHADGAQMIVCENEGADWLDFRPFRAIKASPGAQKKRSHDYTDDVGHRSVEVIWP